MTSLNFFKSRHEECILFYFSDLLPQCQAEAIKVISWLHRSGCNQVRVGRETELKTTFYSFTVNIV